MASPLNTGKRSVDLAAPVRGSRIRRDPPPVVKNVPVRDPEESERQTVIVGVVVFALAIVAITIGISSAERWSPADYNIQVNNL
jgi:hypothetical protein